MAGLPCKLVAQVAFKAGGDVFHHLMSKNPKHFAKVCPSNIQACELHQGEFGTCGSVIQWKYVLDGKEQRSKQVIEVDDEKKQVIFKVIEGDVLELYKNMVISYHVETKGGIDFVIRTIEYELLKPDNPHPVGLLNLGLELSKEVETHIFG
ncbi:hypothetical protein SASPL_137218 [Salvia splendens]|uniref:Bet v I/Major latex protein domain-containing protein n=1 Tax=Salvia splendens TaxID=180675 RepID=A0A8X8WUI4_SALSN|nr:MLP-like protein 34 [Salvia splendens]KAG6400389.1 hypothetical protein SASPL_137218 [Salvia splendens]